MERLDLELADALTERAPQPGPGRFLVVSADDGLVQSVTSVLATRDHRCRSAASLKEAGRALDLEAFDLVLLDPALPDGDGYDAAPRLLGAARQARLIVLGSSESNAEAVQAIRSGASDYLARPIDQNLLLERVDAALLAARSDRERTALVDRLKKICQELNTARHEIAAQVDTLCSDLAAAYRSLSEQVTEVATVSEYRALLQQDLDVEELLRTSLEYMLTKVGPTNAAVFLPDAEQQFGLGAYVNYNCPRDAINVLLDHLGRAICPQMAAETEIVKFDDAKEFASWIGLEASLLANSQVIAYSCRHEGKCLAVVVLFRSNAEPFADECAEMIDLLRPIFAEQLAHIIRIHHRASPQWPDDEPVDDEYDINDDYGFGVAA
jgi:DNA-binding response OmpR family regulator